MKNLTLPLTLTLLALGSSAYAQSITAAPDGVGTVINHNGNTYYIGGGTQAGANLFHSFQEFGLSPSEIANFLSNPQIQNVVGRVMGGNPSVIEGLIQLTGGDSNLYLMNPAGWVFTHGASLDVPGSFGVTTANRMGFEGGFFNAVGDNNFGDLIGNPTSLLFDSTQPGAILNAADLSVDSGSLWMVGGSVINTGSITAPNGTITLAAVPGKNQIKLTHDGMKLGLVLSALPVDSPNPDAPLGLRPEDLPRYLTGGSHVGNANRVEVGPDGQLWLMGSAMRIEQGQVVIDGPVEAENLQLMAAGRVIPTDVGLVSGTTTVVRFPEVGGTNIVSVIDRRADNPEALLYGGAAGTISRIIERDENGLEVISTTLEDIANTSENKLDGVAITAEGHEGNFWLGRNWINSGNVGDHAQELGQWSASLKEGADLLIYSCFTALGAVGEGFVAALGNLTGLDVAASTNATGSANYGGDWNLEYSTGSIEVGTPFTAETLAGWEGRLAIFTVGSAATPTLADAIDAANADAAAPHTINFAPGVTLINLTAALPQITRALTITGEGTNVTIQRNAATQFRIFNVGAVATTFDYLTITGGSVDAGQNGGGIRSDGAVTLTSSTVSGNSATNWGGGIFSSGAVTLTNSTVSGNSATNRGGGIYNSGAVTLTSSTVSGNSATNRGGGIYSGAVTLTNSTVSGNSAEMGGGILSDGAVTLTNSTVSGNSATNLYGGGIRSDGAVTLSNSTVSDNSARQNGGGIFSRAPITLTNSTVSGNSAGEEQGGGIYGGAVTLSNSTVSGNSAALWGGGIFSIETVTVSNSTVSGNSAEMGGGIFGIETVTLSNSTVSGNSAALRGGGIFSIGTVTRLTNSTVSGNSAGQYGGGLLINGAVTLTNSTVSGNSAGQYGGGIRSSGAVTLTNSTIAFNTATNTGGGLVLVNDNTHTFNNSIIANNTAPTGPDVGIENGTHTFNISHSLIRNTAGMDANGSTGVPTNGVNGNIVGLDPRLGPLANNGGPTQTHALLAGSPAINAGGTTALTTDQRGFARVVGGRVDMGAFESEFEPTPGATPSRGLDFALIRRIWAEPMEKTEELVDSLLQARLCRTIPELEPWEEEPTATEDIAAPQPIQLDEQCRPIGEE